MYSAGLHRLFVTARALHALVDARAGGKHDLYALHVKQVGGRLRKQERYTLIATQRVRLVASRAEGVGSECYPYRAVALSVAHGEHLLAVILEDQITFAERG
jgi:hypothetical protein